jgi:hypothetical protein
MKKYSYVMLLLLGFVCFDTTYGMQSDACLVERLRSYYAKVQQIVACMGGELGDLDPCYNQIVDNGSLTLHMQYGMPDYFGTPLGRLNISVGWSSSDKQFEVLKERLRLVEIIPLQEEILGDCIVTTWGPVYAVTKDAQGKTLPIPILPYPFRAIKFLFTKIYNQHVFFTLGVTTDGKYQQLMLQNDINFVPLRTIDALALWKKVKPI